MFVDKNYTHKKEILVLSGGFIYGAGYAIHADPTV